MPNVSISTGKERLAEILNVDGSIAKELRNSFLGEIQNHHHDCTYDGLREDSTNSVCSGTLLNRCLSVANTGLCLHLLQYIRDP